MSSEPGKRAVSLRVGGQLLCWFGVASMLVGGVLLFTGLYSLAQPHRPVTCGGEKMQPGDTCVSPEYSQSFEDRKEMRDEGPEDLYFALPALVVGALCWVAGRKITVVHTEREFRLGFDG